MQFVRVEDGWQLVADGGLVIAYLKSEIEILALHAFCERYMANPQRLPEHFTIDRDGQRYSVTPLGGVGDKLAFVVTGAGVSTTVTTEFVLASEPG